MFKDEIVELLDWSQQNLQPQVKIIFDMPLSKGERINRIAGLGSEMMRLRANRKVKAGAPWTISWGMLNILQELAELGASLDQDGCIHTEA